MLILYFLILFSTLNAGECGNDNFCKKFIDFKSTLFPYYNNIDILFVKRCIQNSLIMTTSGILTTQNQKGIDKIFQLIEDEERANFYEKKSINNMQFERIKKKLKKAIESNNKMFDVEDCKNPEIKIFFNNKHMEKLTANLDKNHIKNFLLENTNSVDIFCDQSFPLNYILNKKKFKFNFIYHDPTEQQKFKNDMNELWLKLFRKSNNIHEGFLENISNDIFNIKEECSFKTLYNENSGKDIYYLSQIYKYKLFLESDSWQNIVCFMEKSKNTIFGNKINNEENMNKNI